MRNMFRLISRKLSEGEDLVLVTVIASSGATPRGAGARMLIGKEGRLSGTIGGGAVEYRSQQMAAKVLEDKRSFEHGFNLTKDDVQKLGMICGGAVSVFFGFMPAGNEKMLEIARRAEECFAAGRDLWLISDIADDGRIGLYTSEDGYIGINAPDWLTEGIADYVRFYLYEPEAHGCDMDLRSKNARYDGMYRVSANFLDFVERRHPGVVKELNALCRQGKYKEETYWKKRTGKTVKELEKEWKSQGDGPFSIYRFCVDGTKRPTYCAQLSEIELLDANGKVIPSSEFELGFAAGSGVFGDGETPDKAVDGDVNTKWLDFRADRNAPAASRASVWLQFKFVAPVKLSGYRWYTANDFEERDPATWRLLGSNDGASWVVIDQVGGFRATSNRKRLAFVKRIR